MTCPGMSRPVEATTGRSIVRSPPPAGDRSVGRIQSTLVPIASWRRDVTPYQWLVLGVAWLGWVFDAMDSTIYALVLHPALADVLARGAGAPVDEKAIGWYGGIVFSIFLVGWAVGGVLFGLFADRSAARARWWSRS